MKPTTPTIITKEEYASKLTDLIEKSDLDGWTCWKLVQNGTLKNDNCAPRGAKWGHGFLILKDFTLNELKENYYKRKLRELYNDYLPSPIEF